MKVVDILAIWGAILSSVLFGIKIWETYRDRRRLLVTYAWDGRPEIGTTITILNPSKTPILLSHYELFWSKSRFGKRKKYIEPLNPEDGPLNATIQSHSSLILNFSEENDFSGDKKTEKLFIRLHLVGRKSPTTLLVYP